VEPASLSVNDLILFAIEAFVVAVMGTVVIVGLYRIVQDRIRESRQLDDIAQEAPRGQVTRQPDDTSHPG
jgi:capsular polysaccharide biosynthesis protein